MVSKMSIGSTVLGRKELTKGTKLRMQMYGDTYLDL